MGNSRSVEVVERDMLSDEDVVARVLGGDVELFELIMRRHNQRLFRVSRAILRNDAEAEDAVQQAYISAFEHLHQFNGEARFGSWLTRIAMRASFARLRRRERRGEIGLESASEENDMHAYHAQIRDPEMEAAGRQLTHLVERAIDGLPEIYRVVVTLREVEQLSTAEAAESLEVSEEVVKIRLHRAKAMLRNAMATHFDAAAGEAFAFLGARCDRIVSAVMAQLSASVDGFPPRSTA